jgi:hypothetical protein
MSDHKELYEYRVQLLARTLAAAHEFCQLCLEIKEPHSAIDGWNVHQIAAHVRDVDRQVYSMRMRRAVEDEYPVFENFDGDAWIAAHYDPAEPLQKILEEFNGNIRLLVDWLENLPAPAWSRLSRHEVYGEFAMQAWAERGLGHIEEHIRAIKKLQGN